ncbi:MAG: hypothetical protein K0S32_524 [Bacteroidetes bacterium]|jgi:hypothetical protein|nr:hypothetical protein [Bacteroidota bacterium]
MKNPFSISLTTFCFIVLFFVSSCENYGSDNIPTGTEDQSKAREVYNNDTTGLNSAAYDPKDTVNHDKTQMQPSNSTGSK